MIKTIKGNKEIYIVSKNSKDLDVELNNDYNAYIITATFFKHGIYAEKSLGVLDTGATRTAISIKALFGDIDDKKYEIISRAVKASNAYIKNFSSVAGIRDITGALCSIPQIQLNERVIKDFMFYLLDDRVKSTFLLGNDFISACDITHIRNKNLTLYNFDKKAMDQRIKEHQYLNLLSIQ